MTSYSLFLFLLSGVMLLYLSCLQVFLMAFIYLIPFTCTATIISSAILSALFLSAGFSLHLKDLPTYLTWFKYVSPTSWMLPFFSNRELSQEALKSNSMMSLCRNMQVSWLKSDIVNIKTTLFDSMKWTNEIKNCYDFLKKYFQI